MQVRREADGAFVLTYDSTLWTKWLLGAAVVFLAAAG